MGVDVRDMPNEAAASLPDRLRDAGFDFEVGQAPDSRHPEVIRTTLRIRRGRDWQRLDSCPDLSKPGQCRVYIANAQGWRRSVRERRLRLQADITAIIEQSGGFWPYPN